MARKKKKGGAGGIAGVLLILLLGALVSIPREVWILLGVILVIGVAIYLFSKSRPAEESVRDEPLLASESSPRSTERLAMQNEPASLWNASPQRPSSFRIPDPPKGFGDAKWLPLNESVTIAGTTIPGGLIYVGTSLPTPAGGNDPCLIDPSKSVTSRGDYAERQMGYWPSYSEIPASARRAYLNWLADGRKDPAADVGYVFIFFYGLERRAIIDSAKENAAKHDWPVIASELRRLLEIYGEKSGSFRSYASSLLDWVSLAEHPEKIYLRPIPSFPRSYELPLYLRVALGQAAVDRSPVPAKLALAWAKLDPATSLRKPATRCAEEFDALFVDKYRQMFGEGIVLPKNRTKLKLVHRPASAGFRGYSEPSLTFGDTPDITVLTAPIKKLQQVVDDATKDLESYSRYIGKNPESKHSLEGLLQLPATLWPESAQHTLEALKKRMGGGMVVLTFQELLSSLDARSILTRDRTLALARALESLNVGVEPDVLAGAKLPKPNEKVVLFVTPAGEPTNRATPAYHAATLTLELASAVAAADGSFSPKEINHLRMQIQSWTHLTPNHTRRLMAHLRLRIAAPASLAALKKKLEPLDAGARHAIAGFMATVAQSDGTVSPGEVKTLEKVYKALGVDPKKVFSDVHAAAAGASQSAATAEPQEAGFTLDSDRIAALQRDTAHVSTLLANIFKDEEEPTEPAPTEVDAEIDEALPASGLLGLDEAHSALARLLLSRPAWTKEEIGDAAADLGVMVDGAIETINEASFDKHDVPFVEGDSLLTVNPELLEKLAA